METNIFIETLVSRRSVKKYLSRKVSDALIEAIVRAGTYAPTGMNKQSPLIVVIRDKETRNKLSRMNAEVLGTESDPFYGAPVVILVLADASCPTCVYDGSLVMGNMLNAAHSLGLGACWIHRAKEEFESPEGRRMLKEWGIEGDYVGIAHCVVGYPALPLSPSRPRKEGYVRYV